MSENAFLAFKKKKTLKPPTGFRTQISHGPFPAGRANIIITFGIENLGRKGSPPFDDVSFFISSVNNRHLRAGSRDVGVEEQGRTNGHGFSDEGRFSF